MEQTYDLQKCLACQCAPVLADIKDSNVLMAKHIPGQAVKEALKGTPVACRNVCEGMWLLYRGKRLQSRLLSKEIQKFLKDYGYHSYQLEDALERLTCRMGRYKEGKAGFPHEMGIFLGYPLEDVKGFICHRGQNYLYSGYWKVYGDVEAAKQIFRQYREEKDRMMLEVQKGKRICILAAGEEGEHTLQNAGGIG